MEEIKLPLILLASEDNVSIPLQSRIKLCIKFPSDLNFSCDYQSILDTQLYIDENDLTDKKLDKYLAEHCPDLAFYYKDMEIRKNKDKIIQILGGLENNGK